MSISEMRELFPGPDPVANARAGFLAEAGRPGILERLRETDAEIARLQAERIRLLGRLGEEALMQAELDAARNPDDDPDRWVRLQWRSAAMELAAAAKLGAESATRQLAEAWTLTEKCEPTLQVLEAGEISFGHAQTIAREVADLDAFAALDAQEILLPQAQKFSVGLFARKARQLLDRGDPDKLADRHRRAFADRHLKVEGARDGMAWLTAYLDAADAAVIASGLHNAAEDARAAGDARTRRQVEADLFVDVLAAGQITIGHVAGATRSVRDRAPISVEVLIPAATLAGDDAAPALIPGIGMIDPRRARELVARAPSLRRILTDPLASTVLDFDRRTYRVPAELKRVIMRRDLHCRAPGCTRPIIEIDHTVGFARGGTTSRGNLAGLCRNHHHLKHEAGWSLVQHADGVLEWTSPTKRHYLTEPGLVLPAEPPPDEWDPAPFDLPDVDDSDEAADDD
ncbi:DUF222 domain-containing protein [Gryllotalpicola reticulitermitis]|uniref:DUF222 domain-containing protein n=1 Tax=Gryllotalpicola reticulitermitis TaxID=1184153 RepID=A0ABV8Q6D8_9MICO